MNNQKILFCFSVLMVFLLSACRNESVCMNIGKSGRAIGDRDAVSASRRYLAAHGFDVSRMTPITFGNSDKLFARNEINKNSGYVLWHKHGETNRYEYVVTLRESSDGIYCRVSKAL